MPLVGRLRSHLSALGAHLRRTHDRFRPRLASGVRLLGPIAESAFADQPWLVERNGRFLHLTELLYRVAELADGTRSVGELADDLSRAIGADVSRDFVWRVLEAKLVPIGVIATDPVFISRSGVVPASASSPRSPLGLNMRVALISPRVIDPATRALQFLFVPPVLLLVLLVTLQAQLWLFFVHSVAASFDAVIRTPHVVPIAVALLVASAAFHELGHAAALRYGGGRVRGMGVGFYLMYPAFYTDVTDNYRLRRWARVRTDLGGFYFNLVFSLALMAVYHVSGQEFLLLVVALTDLDILHQCLPFVRLDGYWALADLTGIPDFFSLMGAYIRSALPMLGWKGRKLPRLKWWAKAVFALYIMVAVPAIALFLIATLQAAPRLLWNAWEAIQSHLADVARAQATGDVLTAASAEGQILLLLLPLLGLSLMLWSLARTAAHGLWLWGRPTPARRLAASVMTAAAAALLAMLWMPGLATPAGYATLLDWVRPRNDMAAPTPVQIAASPTRTVTPTVTPTATATEEVTASVTPDNTVAPVPSPHPTRPAISYSQPTRPAIAPSPRPSLAASPAVRR